MKEKKEKPVKERQTEPKNIGSLLIILMAGILITFVGIGMHTYQKYMLNPNSDITRNIIPILLEAAGASMIFFLFKKETSRKDKLAGRIRILNRIISLYGAIILFFALWILSHTYARTDEITVNDILNDSFLLVLGMVTLLSIYLTPEESNMLFSKISLAKNLFANKVDEFEEEENEEDIEDETYESDLFQEALWEEYPKNLTSWSQKTEFRFVKIIERLKAQKTTTHKQARVNLIIGCAIAVTGLLVLLFIIQFNSHVDIETTFAKFNYFSRLTLVIFVELLAIFFLKIYKENLRDKKYYQNELTNVELKYLAVISSRESKLDQDFSKVISDLSETERNFILKKGESTANLEHKKLDNVSYEKAMDQFSSLIDKIKK